MSNRSLTLKESISRVALVQGAVPRRIGYVVNYSFHIWYKVVMNVIKERAAQYGIQEVLVRDADLKLETELAAVDELIQEKVDVLVVTPVAALGVEAIVEKAGAAGIPLVLEANPLEGMTTIVAICDYDAGVKAGRWVGEYAKKNFDGRANILDIAYPPLRPCLLRSEGFFDGVCSVLPEARLVERVNGEAVVETSTRLAKDVISRHPEVNIIFGMDDESIHGGLKAVKEIAVNEGDFVLAGFGMAGDQDKDLLLDGGPWKVSTAMFPEWVGLRCVDLAVKLFNGEEVKSHDITPTLAVTKDSLPSYYVKTEKGWIPNFETISQIAIEAECARV